MTQNEKTPYPVACPEREFAPDYIPMSDSEVEEILNVLGLKNINELFNHLPQCALSSPDTHLVTKTPYKDLLAQMKDIAQKNALKTSFIGDGLYPIDIPKVLKDILNIRGLTTAYTPYQPERGQGTLMGPWIYSCTMSELTGFEAINASLYDRSTAIFEALATAQRLKRGRPVCLVSEGLHPHDRDVIKTHAKFRNMTIVDLPLNNETGLTDSEEFKRLLEVHAGNCSGVAFSQVNQLGLIEDVHSLTDLAHQYDCKVISVIDPVHLANNGLSAPTEFGKEGADIIVGEGQHLALPPSFGGPGLGVFGIRYNEKDKISVRSTPGRYISRAKDRDGRECLTLVLSTREQHIRREKATSNICSNQSFLATLVGASLLCRGDKGLDQTFSQMRENALTVYEALQRCEGITLPYEKQNWVHELIVELPEAVSSVTKEASEKYDLHLGVDMTERMSQKRNLLKICLSSVHTKNEIEKLIQFFHSRYGVKSSEVSMSSHSIPQELRRKKAHQLPHFSEEEVLKAYQSYGEANFSPDEHVYALGSCTMKYNPAINDAAAGLDHFTNVHPQAPEEDSQGCLEILYEIQESFNRITGLAATTTAPVAGAQGELVGIKMFQAYANDRGEYNRKKIIIPQTAHGTNPATAVYAGVDPKDLIILKATSYGEIDLNHLKEILEKFPNQILGVMVTNPNTSGIFEKSFKKMSELIHGEGGLVYMDGANMNAIAGIVDLNKLGVDAVHNNLHKTWSIPHGGGGPGDGIVSVSQTLVDYLPGHQIIKDNNKFKTKIPSKSIGRFHRHFGNFGHKIRCLTYLKALGSDGIRKMSQVAVLSARYLHQELGKITPMLPSDENEQKIIRMHEFIMTLSKELFDKAIATGTAKAQVIPQVGKLFLDFGLHSPTVAFPEAFGLMIEPTESFSKKELDQFTQIIKSILSLIEKSPQVLKNAPYLTPVRKIDEVSANKTPVFSEKIKQLPSIPKAKYSPQELLQLGLEEICQNILKSSEQEE